MNAPTMMQTTETIFFRTPDETLWASLAPATTPTSSAAVTRKAMCRSTKPLAKLLMEPEVAAVIWMTWLVAMEVRGVKPRMTMRGTDSTGPPTPVRPEPKPEPVKEPEAQQALSVPEEPFRIIGEALHTYIIVEQGEAVLFLDKHAAHERIRFEALKKEDHPIMAQLLLAPVSAELSREEAAAVLENRALLERCGFETEDFGGGDVLIRQIPSDVDVEDAKALLQELAGDLLAGKTLDPDSLRDNLLHTIACKSAIKAGWQTSDEELRRLVQEVLSRDDIKYCPHGRPVCVTLTKRQLEKQFKRV